jgi:hypothetical protein
VTINQDCAPKRWLCEDHLNGGYGSLKSERFFHIRSKQSPAATVVIGAAIIAIHISMFEIASG